MDTAFNIKTISYLIPNEVLIVVHKSRSTKTIYNQDSYLTSCLVYYPNIIIQSTSIIIYCAETTKE